MIDYTVHIGDIVMGVASLIVLPLVKSLSTSLMGLRDSVRDLVLTIGSTAPPTGLLGDVDKLKTEMREHRDWLIEIRDRRHG